MLSNLIYVSVRKPKCTEKEIDNILAACQRNNDHLDITGVLLYSNTHFVQYLEGAYESIFELYEKIKKDDRHENVVMISSSPIRQRYFPSWQMGSKQFSNDKLEFRTALEDNEKELFQSILKGEVRKDNQALDLIAKIFR